MTGFLLRRLQARGRWLGFEAIERGVRLLGVDYEERIQGSTDSGAEAGGHLGINILKEAPEGCLDKPMEFVPCW